MAFEVVVAEKNLENTLHDEAEAKGYQAEAAIPEVAAGLYVVREPFARCPKCKGRLVPQVFHPWGLNCLRCNELFTYPDDGGILCTDDALAWVGQQGKIIGVTSAESATLYVLVEK